MNAVDLVALAALMQLLSFGFLVGRARAKYGVQAPAVGGHPMFERAYRVQMNTLELIVAFVPALYIAARHWAPVHVALVGAVYVAGRFVYRAAYLRDPESRGPGFLLSVAPIATLIVAGAVGALRGLA